MASSNRRNQPVFNDYLLSEMAIETGQSLQCLIWKTGLILTFSIFLIGAAFVPFYSFCSFVFFHFLFFYIRYLIFSYLPVPGGGCLILEKPPGPSFFFSCSPAVTSFSSQRAVPDLKGPNRSGTGGSRSEWAAPGPNREKKCPKICQNIECQKICRIECQKNVGTNSKKNIRRYAR